MSTEYVRNLITSLENGDAEEQFEINLNEITGNNSDLELVCEALSTNSNVTAVLLNRSAAAGRTISLSDFDLAPFFFALTREESTVTQLVCRGSFLIDNFSAIALAFEQNPILNTLVFCFCHLSPCVVKSLNRLIRTNSLECLGLTCCLDEDGSDLTMDLSTGLAQNTSLESIQINFAHRVGGYGTRLDEATVHAIPSFLRGNQRLSNFELKLTHGISSEMAVQIAQAATDHPSLKVLTISADSLEASDATDFVEALQPNAILEHAELWTTSTYGRPPQGPPPLEFHMNCELALDRAGRRILNTPNIPQGLWPLILGRAIELSGPSHWVLSADEPFGSPAWYGNDTIFHFLREKADDILSHRNAARTGTKRQKRDE